MNGLTLIGCGNMGSALVRGLVRSGKADGRAIRVFDVDRSKSQHLAEELGVQVLGDLSAAVDDEARLIVFAVKPQDLAGVVTGLAGGIGDGHLLISIAAGVSTESIMSWLGKSARVIRAMPNAAAMVGKSATAVCKGGCADDSDLAIAADIFSAVGIAVSVDEKMMNVVTALSGSGPGYIFPMMEAFTDGAVLMGLPRPVARSLMVQTFLGAAEMAAAEQAPFSELKDRITSPGGTTIAGLHVMEREGLRGILMEAVAAATRRAVDLDKPLKR